MVNYPSQGTIKGRKASFENNRDDIQMRRTRTSTTDMSSKEDFEGLIFRGIKTNNQNMFKAAGDVIGPLDDK